MLEARGDEGRDRRDDHGNLVDDAARAEAHPYGEADEHVAEHGKEEQLHRRQRGLRLGDGERRLAECTVGEAVVAGEEDQRRGADRARDIAEIDDEPGAQQRGQSDAPAGPGHDHQCVAGEELGAADDHEDEAEREHEAGEEPRDPPGQRAGACQHHGHENGAQGDERAGEHAQGEQGPRIARRLARPRILAFAGHIGRQQRFGCGTIKRGRAGAHG